MRERVAEALKKIRPMLVADEGDVELVAVNDGIVQIRLIGACADCDGCPFVPADDLEIAIEALLKEEIPEIKEVIAI